MRRGRWLLGLTLVAMAALACLGYRERSPQSGARQIDRSPEEEATLELQFGGLDADSTVQQSVQAVGERVVSRSAAAATPYEFQFYVLADTRTVNAFVLPGGPVFITRALFSRLENEAQLAGVLGHQVGHLVSRPSDPTEGSEIEAD